MPRPAFTRLRLLALGAMLALGAAHGAETAANERGQPIARTFLPRDYRGHDQIWKITETDEGVMLFGNFNQVVEYDGLTWRLIPVPGGSYIRAMARDDRDTVWVAGVDELGRLVKDAAGRLNYESLRARVPEQAGNLGAIWCIHVMPDGVYFQGNSAVLRWDGAKFDVWPMDDMGVVLSYRIGDALWVSRSNGWFAPKPGGTWEEIAPFDLLPRFIWRAPDGRLIIGTGTKGLQVFAGGKLEPVSTEIDEWLKTKKPCAALGLPGDKLLIHSLQGGAVILGPGLKFEASFDETSGLAAETVLSAHLDRRGVLWLGTDNGICRLEYASPVRVFGPAHGLGRSGPESMQRVDNRLLLSTARSVLELVPPDKLPGSPHLRET